MPETSAAALPDHGAEARGSGWRRRWQERWRQGGGVCGYHLLRRVLVRSGIERIFDLQIHDVIAVAPWRLQLPPRLARGLQVRELEAGDLRRLQQLRPAVGEGYGARFQQAHRCWGAFLEERLVAFLWLRCGPARLASGLGCSWQLSAQGVWLYDLYTDPAVLGAITHLYLTLRRQPPSPGCRLLAGVVGLDNQRSRATHASLGYRRWLRLWTVRLGGWRFHVSHAPGAGGWGYHRRGGAMRLWPAREVREGSQPFVAGAWVQLQCSCGRGVVLMGDVYRCGCGRELGRLRQGVAELAGHPRGATVPEYERGYERGIGLQDVLAMAPGARVLVAGPGWGEMALALARDHDVVVVETSIEHARQLAERQQREQLPGLQLAHGDLATVQFVPGQFDLVVTEGGAAMAAGQQASAGLERLRELLSADGQIVVILANRLAWRRWRRRGRPAAAGLRGYSGYRRQFAAAGLGIVATWMAVGGRVGRENLVPLHAGAMRFHARMATAEGRWRGVRRPLRAAYGWRWARQWFGAEYVFQLKPDAGAEPARTGVRSHPRHA